MAQFSFDEIRRHGQNEERIMLSLLGIAYDVTSGADFFGSSGPYRVYSGHDATFALATMSLKAEDLDRFDYELDSDDLQCLADWIAYFDKKYTRAGTVDVQHPLSLDDLPTGKDPTKLINASHPAVNTTEDEQRRFEQSVGAEYHNTNSSPSEVKGASKPQPGLARWLIVSTNDLHEKALRGEFMQAMMQRKITRHMYAPWLAALHTIYSELEQQLAVAPPDSLVHRIDDARLRRLDNIREDLRFFYKSDSAECLPSPSLHTIRYVSRISDIAHEQHRLVVHHWMRYGGGLAGGQFLKTVLKPALKLDASNPHTCPGIRYHQFDKIADVQGFYEEYLMKLDELEIELTETMKQEMVEEAMVAFQLNINLNDEFAQPLQVSARL